MTRDRWLPVVVAVAAVLVGNGLIRALGIGGDTAGDGPPGWVVGGVWTALFACFGVAYAALVRAPATTEWQRVALVGLGLICLAYPVYTAGFDRQGVALAGTVATGLYAAALVAWFWRSSRPAALLVAPILPWLVVAGFALI